MSENPPGVSADMEGDGGRRGEPLGKLDERGKIDWERLGLRGDDATGKLAVPDGEFGAGQVQAHDEPTFDKKAEKNELFSEDLSVGSRPWWKANFFVSEPILFGTWDGVFTSCMINIFGVLIFLRTGWMVGNAGLGFSILIIFMTIGVALVAVLSAIGVCERCHMESGGVYFLVSQVLGARIGATIGILYCFGQAVACSLCVVGFGESIASLIERDDIWIARGIAVAVLVILLGINIAGVKWVIRLQLLLLIILFVAVLDFAVGSFVHTDPENGFLGYKTATFVNNTRPDYEEGQNFFTVFGVFFPTATGVFAGINMSGDLRNPSKSIPVGTLSAIAVSTTLYMVFALILGATCVRSALQDDYLVAEKVSITGFLFLAGLYISSISSGMGGLYGSPRIVQGIANDGVIPVIRCLSKGRGANKVPVLALLVVASITVIFIFIGKVNTLGPVVTMPFMFTYAAVDYSNFVLYMSYDDNQHKVSLDAAYGDDNKPDQSHIRPAFGPQSCEYGTLGEAKERKFEGSVHDETEQHLQKTAQDGVHKEKGDVSETTSLANDACDTTSLLGNDNKSRRSPQLVKKPNALYFIFCNPWLSLFGCFATLAAMFAIQWIYALANVLVGAVIFIYIGFANPGVFPGLAKFSLLDSFVQCVKRLCCCCCRNRPVAPEQVIVTPGMPAMQTTSSQLTEENEDFAARERYHQSEVVEGKNFDDFGRE